MRAKREIRLPTEAELEALWRKDPAFIGPVGPPMVLWLMDKEAQQRWRIQVSLDGARIGEGASPKTESTRRGPKRSPLQLEMTF